MSEDVQTTTPGLDPGAPPNPVGPIPFGSPRRRWRRPGPGANGKPPKPKLRKLRFMLILLGLSVLAFISTVFGMMMAVASDLPQLENSKLYKTIGANSFLLDHVGKPIGVLAPPQNVILINEKQIGEAVKDAVVSVEDKRFYQNTGVDIRGIARAFVSDISGGPRQGASTIAQQFVKLALAAQRNRTVFEKLREAALAYHLTRKWSKSKILAEYLNAVYFGNGAYGIESAARVYFGSQHGFNVSTQTSQSTGACSGGQLCSLELYPYEAAMLAGIIANPSAYDPIAHPQAARARRLVVLRDMLQQHYISLAQFNQGKDAPLPTQAQVARPQEPTLAPYFTSWVRPQIINAVGSYRAYYGGLTIHTSLDLGMQQAAEQAISQVLPSDPTLPRASMVAIDNKTGEVRAMVGGPLDANGQEDFKNHPFNWATEGHRQPGSSFKPFTLAVALKSGISPDSTWTSAPADFIVPNSGGKEHFLVRNFANSYSGSNTLAGATTVSDNSIYARVGIEGLGRTGTQRIAAMATAMGIRSPISTNYAMILGGLRIGVTPLDMAHAYETFAMRGQKVVNPAFSPTGGPIGIEQIDSGKSVVVKNVPRLERVLPASVAQTVHDILTTVVSSGTATQASISGVDVAGKTGTTSNYGDAWFVGWTPELTTAVWVGFPDKLVPMTTLYNGQPVEGGTYPAIIWHDFMTAALQIYANEQAASSQNGATNTTTTAGGASGGAGSGSGAGAGSSSGSATTPATPTTPATGGGTGAANGAGNPPPAGGTTGAGAGGGGGTTGTGTGGGGGGTGGGGGGGGSGGTSPGSGGAGLGH